MWEENSGARVCEDTEIWVSSCLVQGSFFFLVIFRWCVLDFEVELDIFVLWLCWGHWQELVWVQVAV